MQFRHCSIRAVKGPHTSGAWRPGVTHREDMRNSCCVEQKNASSHAGAGVNISLWMPESARSHSPVCCPCGDGSRCRHSSCHCKYKTNLRGTILCRSRRYTPAPRLPHLVAALECKIAGVTCNLRLETTRNAKGCQGGWVALGVTSQGAYDVSVETDPFPWGVGQVHTAPCTCLLCGSPPTQEHPRRCGMSTQSRRPRYLQPTPI